MSHYNGRKKRSHFTNHSRVPREAVYWARFSIQTWGLRDKYARMLHQLIAAEREAKAQVEQKQLLLAAE